MRNMSDSENLGVRFTSEPMRAGKVKVAVFDDTCGNLIQLMQVCAGS